MADVCANSMACHPRATYHIAGCCHLVNSVAAPREGGGRGRRGTCPGCITLCPDCAPAVELHYSDVDHKRISWHRARHYFEDVNYDVINITLNSFLVNMDDIRLRFTTRSSAVAERPHDASCR